MIFHSKTQLCIVCISLMFSHPTVSISILSLVILLCPVTHLAALFCNTWIFLSWFSIIAPHSGIIYCNLLKIRPVARVLLQMLGILVPSCTKAPNFFLTLGSRAFSHFSKWEDHVMLDCKFPPSILHCPLSSICFVLPGSTSTSRCGGCPWVFPLFWAIMHSNIVVLPMFGCSSFSDRNYLMFCNTISILTALSCLWLCDTLKVASSAYMFMVPQV